MHAAVTEPVCRARMRFGNYLSLLIVAISISCFAQGYRVAVGVHERLATVETKIDGIKEDVHDIKTELKPRQEVLAHYQH